MKNRFFEAPFGHAHRFVARFTQNLGLFEVPLLNLVVAKGYLTKLLANGAVKSHIGRHQPEILTHLELVVNTVSMEETVHQQLDADATEPAAQTVPV